MWIFNKYQFGLKASWPCFLRGVAAFNKAKRHIDYDAALKLSLK